MFLSGPLTHPDRSYFRDYRLAGCVLPPDRCGGAHDRDPKRCW